MRLATILLLLMTVSWGCSTKKQNIAEPEKHPAPPEYIANTDFGGHTLAVSLPEGGIYSNAFIHELFRQGARPHIIDKDALPVPSDIVVYISDISPADCDGGAGVLISGVEFYLAAEDRILWDGALRRCAETFPADSSRSEASLALSVEFAKTRSGERNGKIAAYRNEFSFDPETATPEGLAARGVAADVLELASKFGSENPDE
ncbi:hypothetical protein [Limisalsivibrio acetivorans]|uniref:hypothetical protein n=1 Tax=Limisalsivibrio acetivorans TaxID=1304888 RepID=UPI0003B63EB6|nr:hypothetical protein [Limisalsivibrio acetivorans]